MNEGELRKQIIDLLDLFRGRLYYVALTSAPSIGREGKARKGQPDIVGWVTEGPLYSDEQGAQYWIHPFAWELKGSRGRLSDAQRADLEWAEECGGDTQTIWSLDEAIEALQGLGLEVEVR